MGMISDVTIGTDTFKVYAITADPLVDAESWMAGKIGTTEWDAATDPDKNAALVSAARWIDRVIDSWTGTVTVAGQPRDWPRNNATCDGVAIPDGTTPDALAYAEFELANILIIDPSAQDASSQGSNVKKAKAGSAEVVFFTGTLGTTQDTRLPSVAHDMINCFFASQGLIPGTASGVDDDSAFGSSDFDRSAPFA